MIFDQYMTVRPWMPWDNINSPFFSLIPFPIPGQNKNKKSFYPPEHYPLRRIQLWMDINLIISCCVKSTFFYFKPFHVLWDWQMRKRHVHFPIWCYILLSTPGRWCSIEHVRLMFYRTRHFITISVALSAEQKFNPNVIKFIKRCLYSTTP